MRAPPEVATRTNGERVSSASSAPRVTASPTPLPMLPPMNAKSIAARTTGPAADRARAVDRALAEPGLALRVGEPLRVRLRVGEAEHVERLDLAARAPSQLPSSRSCSSRCRTGQAEVEVALRADAERPLQPLVVDERVAGGALRPLDGGLRGRWCRHCQTTASDDQRFGVEPTVLARERASVSSTCSRVGASRPASPKTRATISARMSVVRPCRSMRVASTARSSARRQELALQLGLDHAVVGVDLVLGVVVDLAQAPERSGRLRPAELERELGDVERGEDVVRRGLRDLLRRLERLERPAQAPVRGDEAPARDHVLRDRPRARARGT